MGQQNGVLHQSMASGGIGSKHHLVWPLCQLLEGSHNNDFTKTPYEDSVGKVGEDALLGSNFLDTQIRSISMLQIMGVAEV